MSTIYSGPGKVWYHDAVAFQAQGENGQVTIDVNQATDEVSAALFGRIGEQVRDLTADISVTPFDDWALLPYLFPTTVGAKYSNTEAALVIGTRPHAATVAAGTHTKVWTPDGRLYDLVRTAIVGHPTLHLGVGKPLFGDVRIAAIGDATKTIGASGYLFEGSASTESGATDPGGQMSMTNFVRSSWTGVWGTAAGFGNDGSVIEAEDEWTVVPDIKYSALTVQGRTVGYKLDSAAYMVRVRPVGPTHTQILAQVAAYTRGSLLGTASLGLTDSVSSKVITLPNCAPKGVGFEFGGTKLGTGEVGFVAKMAFTSGNPTELIVFSS